MADLVPGIVVCIIVLQYCFPDYKREICSLKKFIIQKGTKMKIACNSTTLSLSHVLFVDLSCVYTCARTQIYV